MLRKDKFWIRFAELQARVEKARFGQGSYKVRQAATTGFKSPRLGAAALISIASWGAHHISASRAIFERHPHHGFPPNPADPGVAGSVTRSGGSGVAAQAAR